MSNPTLGDALHRMTDGVGELGDIDRALHDVRTRRIRITVGTLAATCLAILLVACGRGPAGRARYRPEHRRGTPA
jgi:hypothetical protein